MGSFDGRIGRNLGAVRSRLTSITASGLALSMRVRGWDWDEGTTADIEAGRRPLLLAEAQDVGSALGSSDRFLVGRTEADTSFEIVSSLLDRASHDLEETTEQWFDVHEDLSSTIETLGLTDPDGPVPARRCISGNVRTSPRC